MEPQDYPPILLLPTEILLEILSYHHTTPVPYERWRLAGDILFGRFAVLRALSQTCRTFRNIFLPLVWENVEAVDDDRRGRHIPVLQRRMMGILKTPSLPRCVRTLLVSLTLSAPNWNFFTVFARFIQATPNLSGLHIVDVSQRHAGALSGALLSQSFPSIRELTIPALLAGSLSAFPNIQLLICADSYAVDYDAIALLKSARQYCPPLKSIVNFTPSLPVIHCEIQSPHDCRLEYTYI
ncbi:hypothetical protein C8R43DRAFT_528332 [Mycena crocata]|nr:hypothetical protein C8R43DRAFT_528332 [Mycena crocata]